MRLLTLCAVAALVLAGCGGGGRTAGGLPPVVLVTLDTTRADHLGAYGNPRVRTPNLDRLARRSIQLADCTTVAPTTLASHTSIFTGVHPHTHGTPRNGFTVHPDNELLAEVLAEAGYRTAGFIGSFALDERFGVAQGFDVYDQEFDLLDGSDGYEQDQRRAEAVTDAALAYLDDPGSGSDRPLFLFAHYFDPHVPYRPPSPFGEMSGDPDPGERIDHGGVREAVEAAPGTRPPGAVRLEHRYAGEVAYVDRELGRLLDGLERRGILQSALVLVTGDHGENFTEHPRPFDHGLTVYATTVSVPCLVRLPGRPARLESMPVSTIDLLPTLLGALDLEVPGACEGTALPRASDPLAVRSRFAQATKPWEDVEVEGRWHNLYKARCLIRDSWKLVQTPYRGSEELYDLAADPAERHDLLAASDPRADRIVPELREELESFAKSGRPLPSEFDDSQLLETIERLRRMGYLDPAGAGE